MSQQNEFVSFLVESLQLIGPVTAKRMFGGHGIFLEGLMFGLVASSTLYFKVDDENIGAFKKEGMGPFTYSRKGKEFAMPYYQAPDEAMEDGEELIKWANLAYGAAIRAAARKNNKKTKASKKSR